ncbi:MAG: NAD(P)-dependent oxidoreductase [Massilibacillus sp.]|jgi:dTDP-4-dehydrorhamnose reductase|nr:NAD(P)-dependent oxidoreductase [Massilibacillus sp.]
MKRILITGGRGFFASRFAKYYKDQYEILAPTKAEMNVNDQQDIMEKFQAFKPDYVIHTAAIAVTDYCNQNPEIAHKINVEGAISIAKATKAVGAKLVFISTEQIFNGNQNVGPFKETDEAKPDTVYGQNKLEAEKLLKEIIAELWVVRFTWLFGMPEKNCGMSGNIFWSTIESILKNERIYASPHEFRGVTYVYEMVEAVNKIFTVPYGIYHLGSENNKSRYEIIKEIFCGLGLEHRIQELLVEDKEKYLKKNRDVRLDNQKSRSYGIEFSNSSDAIQQCIAQYGLKLK